MLIPIDILPKLKKLNLGTILDENPRMGSINIKGIEYFVFSSFLMYDTDDNSYSWLLLFKNKATNERITYICDTDYKLSEIHADSRVVLDVLYRAPIDIESYQVLECNNPLSRFIDSVSNKYTNYFEVSVNNVIFKFERNEVERYILALIEFYKKTGKFISLKVNSINLDIFTLASITTKTELKAKGTYIIKIGSGIFFSPCDPIKFLDDIVLSDYLHESYTDSMTRKIRLMHKTYERLSLITDVNKLAAKYKSRYDYNINWVTNTCYIRLHGVAGAGSEFKLVPFSDLELRLAELTEYSGTSMNEAGLGWFFSARDMICTHSGFTTEYLTIYGVAINYVSRCTVTDDELIVPCQSFDIHFKLKDKKQVVLLLTKCNLQEKKIEPVTYRHQTLNDGTLVITRNDSVVLKNNYTKEFQ